MRLQPSPDTKKIGRVATRLSIDTMRHKDNSSLASNSLVYLTSSIVLFCTTSPTCMREKYTPEAITSP